jgi:hypothetical protein
VWLDQRVGHPALDHDQAGEQGQPAAHDENGAANHTTGSI